MTRRKPTERELWKAVEDLREDAEQDQEENQAQAPGVAGTEHSISEEQGEKIREALRKRRQEGIPLSRSLSGEGEQDRDQDLDG